MRAPHPHVPLASFVAASALLLAGCAGAPEADEQARASAGYPVEITSCGAKSTVEARPERAITMNQGATEVALALGVADQLAGTAYLDDQVADRWKKEYDEVPVLAKEYPDTETVLAAKPDFVYASYVSAFDAEAAGDRGDLEQQGIASYVAARLRRRRRTHGLLGDRVGRDRRRRLRVRGARPCRHDPQGPARRARRAR